jgi:hypothetical protein
MVLPGGRQQHGNDPRQQVGRQRAAHQHGDQRTDQCYPVPRAPLSRRQQSDTAFANAWSSAGSWVNSRAWASPYDSVTMPDRSGRSRATMPAIGQVASTIPSFVLISSASAASRGYLMRGGARTVEEPRHRRAMFR